MVPRVGADSVASHELYVMRKLLMPRKVCIDFTPAGCSISWIVGILSTVSWCPCMAAAVPVN